MMSKEQHKLLRLEVRVLELEEQLGDLIFFLNDAMKMRKSLNTGIIQPDIDRLLP